MVEDYNGGRPAMKENKIEKLIEEIDWIIFHDFPRGIHSTRKEAIIKAITRIGKAYADGGAELPGQFFYLSITPCFFDQVRKLGLKDGDILIALRQEKE